MTKMLTFTGTREGYEAAKREVAGGIAQRMDDIQNPMISAAVQYNVHAANSGNCLPVLEFEDFARGLNTTLKSLGHDPENIIARRCAVGRIYQVLKFGKDVPPKLSYVDNFSSIISTIGFSGFSGILQGRKLDDLLDPTLDGPNTRGAYLYALYRKDMLYPVTKDGRVHAFLVPNQNRLELSTTREGLGHLALVAVVSKEAITPLVLGS